MTDFIKRGKKYYCPFDCGDSRFPQPSWKTEKGAQRHVDNCSMRPEKVKEREDIDLKRKADDLKNKNIKLALDEIKLKEARYKVGDEVSFVHMRISKPTHEMRGTRMVKVRYEDEYSFSARTVTIKKVSCHGGRIIYNGCFYESSTKDSHDLAHIEATKRQKQHLESNKLASDLR